MQTRDYRDIIGGGLLIVGGLTLTYYATKDYELGTVGHMGPGMLPAALGYLLAGIGGIILVPALFRPGPVLPKPDYRQFVAVLAGVLAFALTVEVLGMVPAIFLVTIAAVLADDKIGVVGTVILAVTLSIIATLIFRIGLAIPLQPFKWPF